MGFTELNLTDNKIQLVIADNPFSMEKEILFVERATFRELFCSYTRNRFPIEQAIIFDTDTRVLDFDTLPSSEYVTIQIVPTGGVGDALRDFGAVFRFFFSDVLPAIILSKLGINIDLPDSERIYDPLNQSRGAVNQNNIGNRVPVVLGRHLVTPVLGGNSFITVAYGSNEQVIHQLFVVGYNDVTIEDTVVNSITEPDIRFGDIHISQYTNNYDINYGSSSQHAYYPRRVVSTFPQTEIYSDSGDNARDPSTGFFICTSPEKTKAIEFGFTFNQGLRQYSDNAASEYDSKIYIRLTDKVTNIDYYLIPGTTTDTDFNYISSAGSFAAFSQTGGSLDFTISAYDDPGAPGGPYPTSIKFAANTQIPSRIVFTANLPESSQWAAIQDHAFEIGISATYTKERDINKYVDATYIEFVNFYTYGSSVSDDAAIVSSTKAKLTTIAATFSPSGGSTELSNKINVIAQLTGKNYTGTTGQSGPSYWTSSQDIRNPASVFLYVLTNPLINKDYTYNTNLIDWGSLEAWYTFCENGGNPDDSSNPLTFDKVYSNATTVEEMLDAVAASGWATWTLLDGKISIIIDKPRTVITQYFTPKNSKDFQGSKEFFDPIDAIEVSYTSPLTWLRDSITVYANPSSPTEENKNSITATGFTSYNNAQLYGQYILKSALLRPETFSFTAYSDSIVCTIGDRIKIQHDVPLIGAGISGRFLGFDYNDSPTNTEVSRIYVDELFEFNGDSTYKLIVRPLDPSTSEVIGGETISNIQFINITNPALPGGTATNEISPGVYAFNIPSPYEDASTVDAGMLYMPGVSGYETIDLLVENIDYKHEAETTITGILYDENIYTSGAVPTYSGVMTVPPSIYGTPNYTTVYDLSALLDGQTVLLDSLNDKVSYSQIIDGTTSNGSITSLSAPVVAAVSYGRSVTLALAHSDDVAGSSLRFELQISDDNATWYSINNPCDDPTGPSDTTYKTSWQGTLNAHTTCYQNTFHHERVPFNGTPGIPIAKTYYYRVRAASGITTVIRSAAYTTISINVQPLVSIDLEQGSIVADKIDVDDLFALNATIAGWYIDETKLKSAEDSARIELNKELNRMSVFDSVNEKVAMGYLDGLPAYNGSGTATAGGTYTLTDATKDWVASKFVDAIIEITAGTGAGQTRTVTGNTATVITVSVAWNTVPDTTSEYEIAWPQSMYGFWAREGDKLVIDGSIAFVGGDMLLQADTSLLVQDSSGDTYLRIGTYNGTKGITFFEDFTDPAPDDHIPQIRAYNGSSGTGFYLGVLSNNTLNNWLRITEQGYEVSITDNVGSISTLTVANDEGSTPGVQIQNINAAGTTITGLRLLPSSGAATLITQEVGGDFSEASITVYQNNITNYIPDEAASAWRVALNGGTNLFSVDKDGNTTISGTLSVLTSGVERMMIDASGNVGIGHTSLSYKLDVVGTVRFVAVGSGWTDGITIQTSGGSRWNVLADHAAANQPLRFRHETFGGEPMALYADKAFFPLGIEIGGGMPSLVFSGTGTGTYTKTTQYVDSTYGYLLEVGRISDSVGASPIPFTITARGGSSTYMLSISASGNVGIGTTSPLYPLHVIGTGEFSGGYVISKYGIAPSFYQGSYSAEYLLPIGTYIAVRNASGYYNRNGSYAVYLASNTYEYYSTATGTRLSGTWRASGATGNNGLFWTLMRRTA